MILHEMKLDVTREEIDKIHPADSLHFDLRGQGIVREVCVDLANDTNIVELTNLNWAWFYGDHNRYFTINNKPYWLSAIRVNALTINVVTAESIVYLEGKFVNQSKSISFLTNRDMRGNYTSTPLIDALLRLSV